MYLCTSFSSAKTCKIGVKGVFLVMFIDLESTQLKKLEKKCKNVYLGSIFTPAKYMLRVRFKSPFTRMISSLKYKSPHTSPIEA